MATPLVLSPSSPSELLHYVVSYQTYPTTLLICQSRGDFLEALYQDVQERAGKQGGLISQDADRTLSILSDPLYQRAVARHISIIFIPTVTHLRAYLASFSPCDLKVLPPPGFDPLKPSDSAKPRAPLLLVYGFLDIHRNSSEWSAQGIGNTAAALVEAAQRCGFRAIAVEPRGAGGHENFDMVLADPAPVLSGGTKRREEGGWTGRTIETRRILGRWFRFQRGQWDVN